MRINEETVLVGKKVVLVPYRKEHVEKYHAWMSNEEIRQQTASEPLTLEEEYEMQKSWQEDDDKLTFIILGKSVKDGSSIKEILENCPMVGDVNLFLSSSIQDDNDDDKTSKTSMNAELEVMIAEPGWRHKGLAMEALMLLMHYASTISPQGEVSKANLPLSLDTFLCKIGYENNASRHLFEKLGFREVRRSEIWKEIEMRPVAGASYLAKSLAAPIRVLHWPLTANEIDPDR